MNSMITPLTPPFNTAVRNAAKEFRPGYIAAVTSFAFTAILKNEIVSTLITDNYGDKHMGKSQILAAYLNTNGSGLYELPWKRSFMMLAEANQSCENLTTLLEETLQSVDEDKDDDPSFAVFLPHELETFRQFKDFLSYVAHHARQTTGYIQDMQEICGKDMTDRDYQMQSEACLSGDAKDASMRFIPLNTLKLAHYFLPIIENILVNTAAEDVEEQEGLNAVRESLTEFKEDRPDPSSFDNETYEAQAKTLNELNTIQEFLSIMAKNLGLVGYRKHGTLVAIEAMASFCNSYIMRNDSDPNGGTVVSIAGRGKGPRLQHSS